VGGGNQLTSDGRPPPPRRRDQIANTSDVYLEQLKADTKARKESFLLGDYEGHQRVWESSKIKELENALNENPFYERYLFFYSFILHILLSRFFA